MFIDGVLIEAKDLVNGVSIVQEGHVDEVAYIHIELESHDVILAEGAWSETFLDENNRGMFHNACDHRAPAGRGAGLPDQRYYAPRIESGFALEQRRRKIAAIAGRGLAAGETA